MKIATIFPNNAFVPSEFVECLMMLKGYDFIPPAVGPSLPDNRNGIFQYAKFVIKPVDDLLFIDSDIVFTPEQVKIMEEDLKIYDAVSGIYMLGNPPKLTPAILGKGTYDYKFIEPKEGINEIDACGGGFFGISKRVIETLKDHPFSNIREGSIVHGEDVSFCVRLKEAGFKLWCDSRLKVGHIRKVASYYEKTDRS